MAEDSNKENEKEQKEEEDAEENETEDQEEGTEEEDNEDTEEQKEEVQDDADDDNEDEEGDEGEEDGGEDVEVPEKFADIIEEIEAMPVIELNELVTLLEKKWGVSAQAVAAGGGGGGSEEEEEKDAYDIELTDFGDSKISVIKQVKALLGLGLKEAKSMVEDAPVVLKEGVPAEDAEEMKEKVEEEGGTVELK